MLIRATVSLVVNEFSADHKQYCKCIGNFPRHLVSDGK